MDPTDRAAVPPPDVVARVEHLSKVYRVFSRPHHRVAQALSDRRGWDRRFCFEVAAVHDVSFELERGQSIAIIGRNGSGKSTLLQMIAGTLAPTSGEVHLSGRVSALLELGAGFNADFTGRQNFRVNASIQGLTETQIREIEPAVEEFSELGVFIDEPVRTYSTGMYVRLAFAAAVHVIPELLIVDEALAVGDIFFQQKCFEYLSTHMADATKIIVTHDLASASRLADRCIVMDKGHVVFDGEPLEAVELYTALHLGERSVAPGRALDGRSAEQVVDAPDEALNAPPAGSSSSAPDAMRVLGVAVSRAVGTSWKRLDPDAVIASPEDRLRFQFEVELGQDVAEPVWGYLVRDRVGNALFGQNTVGSGLAVAGISAGRHLVEFEIEWPEVDAGQYVLTLGLGDGRHPLHHKIVAWAQSLVKVSSNPTRAVHGAFNNDLKSFSIGRLVDDRHP